MKRNSIILVLIALLFVVLVQSMTSCVSSSNIYPVTGKVIGLNYDSDVVTFETDTGIRYQFYGTEDYAIGDCISVVMDRNGTPLVTDDIVLFAYYSSWNIERG